MPANQGQQDLKTAKAFERPISKMGNKAVNYENKEEKWGGLRIHNVKHVQHHRRITSKQVEQTPDQDKKVLTNTHYSQFRSFNSPGGACQNTNKIKNCDLTNSKAKSIYSQNKYCLRDLFENTPKFE